MRLLYRTWRRGSVVLAPGRRPIETIAERTSRRCRSRRVTTTRTCFPVFACTIFERMRVISRPRALAAATTARVDDVVVDPAARRETVVLLRLLVVVCVLDWAPPLAP